MFILRILVFIAIVLGVVQCHKYHQEKRALEQRIFNKCMKDGLKDELYCSLISTFGKE